MALTRNASTLWNSPPATMAMTTALAAAAVHIYAGALVGRNPAGYAKPFEPGDDFWGIADEEFNNVNGAAGAVSTLGDDGERGKSGLRIVDRGSVTRTLSGVGNEDIGKAVYATADDAIAFSGNADAFMGRITGVNEAGQAIIELKRPGEKTRPEDLGSVRIFENGSAMREATGAASSTKYYENGITAKSILGLGISASTGSGGGLEGEFDAVSEVALASLRSNDIFPVSGGIKLRGRLCITDKGDNAALDIDFGLGTLLTTASEADFSDAAMVNKIAFHMDGNSDNINGWCENANTEVAAVDTTIDNDSTTDVAKEFIIIVRTSGTCELWIDSGSGFVRVLDGTTGAATTLTVASNVNLALFLNMEKTADDTTAKWKLRELECSGSRS